jgi:hypothetical protein
MNIWVPKMMTQLKPTYLALKPGEDSLPNIKSALSLITQHGYQVDTVTANEFAIISSIKLQVVLLR